jgi:peptide/nickel transport system permease protein
MSRFGLHWVVAVFWLCITVFSLLIDLDIRTIHLDGILQPLGSAFVLGQDDLGRPLLDRLVYGVRISLMVALGVTLLAGITGVLIGTLSAWYGGAIDHFISRLIDSFMAFPGLLLAIALAGLLGPGIDNLVIALSVVGWVGFARLSRAQVFSLKNRDHVQAARAVGSSDWRIIRLHLIPLIAAPLMVEATFTLASVVIAEAGLSFLGIGIQPPEASLGNMIRDGSRYLLIAPHLVLVPGLALASIVYAVNAIGDQLRDSQDVRLISRNRL